MTKGCKDIFFVKKLYFNAGRTIKDYLYFNYSNLVDRAKLKLLIQKILFGYNQWWGFDDAAGGCITELCRLSAEILGDKGNVFLYIDDYFSADVFMAVFAERNNKFIYSTGQGVNMKKFYYRTQSLKYPMEKYLSMAESYFEKSEYIAKNSVL